MLILCNCYAYLYYPRQKTVIPKLHVGVQARWRGCSGSGWPGRARRTTPRERRASRSACSTSRAPSSSWRPGCCCQPCCCCWSISTSPSSASNCASATLSAAAASSAWYRRRFFTPPHPVGSNLYVMDHLPAQSAGKNWGCATHFIRWAPIRFCTAGSVV